MKARLRRALAGRPGNFIAGAGWFAFAAAFVFADELLLNRVGPDGRDVLQLWGFAGALYVVHRAVVAVWRRATGRPTPYAVAEAAGFAAGVMAGDGAARREVADVLHEWDHGEHDDVDALREISDLVR